ncbi:purine and uridine phosphorylase [Trichoderma chlorosporum]
MSAESLVQLTHGDYTVGWVCALPKEQTAALYMLETKHEDLPNPINDHNAYYLGQIGGHNVVIACLPMGRIGNNSSAVVAAQMISTFSNIKVGLMVGIGGGMPPSVRLGDVVVSCAKYEYPGVIQWDMGESEKDGLFKRTGSLNNPPAALLTAISKFDTETTESRAKMSKYLADFKSRKPDFITADMLKDVLYKSSYSHLEGEGENCDQCDESMILKREAKEAMTIHYDAQLRDKLGKEFGGNLLCLEMEAAGLMNEFPCIVIRGICDYADSHKNKAWQEYAAVMAAAYAKTLLTMLPVSDVSKMKTIKGECALQMLEDKIIIRKLSVALCASCFVG